jgi:hypothetical protein
VAVAADSFFGLFVLGSLAVVYFVLIVAVWVVLLIAVLRAALGIPGEVAFYLFHLGFGVAAVFAA